MSPHEPRSGPPTAGSTSDDPPRLGITVNQLVGSAVAAAAAAFGASFLGVAGTIIGAAVASVIATVASATYTRSLQGTRAVVQSTVTQWSRTAATAPVVDPDAPTPEEKTRGRRPALRVAVAGLAVMALTFGALTGMEAVLGKPIAGLLGSSNASGTTLGAVTGTGRSDATPRRTPATSPTSPSTSPTPSTVPSTVPSATPSAEPSAAPATPTPSSTPTPAPTAGPTTSPAATPTG